MEKFTRKFVGSAVFLSAFLFLFSCASTPVKGYRGSDLPPEKTAIIEPHSFITIVTYDGEKLPGTSNSVAVVPGVHTIEVSTFGSNGMWTWEAGHSHLFFEFNAEEGHTYVIRYVDLLPNEWSMYVVDKKSGEKVKGSFVSAPPWALSNFDAAIKKVPDDAEAWVGKTSDLLGLKRYDEALQANDTAIRLRPNDPIVWNTRGLIFLRTDRYKEALKAFQKTTELGPQEPFGWFNIGLTLELMEEYSKALQVYDKVLELKPGDTEVQNRKAEVLEKQSRKQDKAI
jgi:hypothetical protein